MITDPVLAATEGYAARAGLAARGRPRRRRVRATRRSTCRWRRSTPPPAAGREARPDVARRGRRRQRDRPRQGDRAAARARRAAQHATTASTWSPGPIVPLIALPDDRGHRLGGHAGLGHRRPGARDEGRHLEPVPDPAHGDLRPELTRTCPPSRHRALRHRRALARDRGVHGGDAAARLASCRSSGSPSARTRSPTCSRSPRCARSAPASSARSPTATTWRRAPGCSSARSTPGSRSPTPASRPRMRCSSRSARRPARRTGSAPG